MFLRSLLRNKNNKDDKISSDLQSSWESLNPGVVGSSKIVPKSPLREQHQSLKGSRRLDSLVKELGSVPCPWTDTVGPLTMLMWLKSEVKEVAVEIKKVSDREGGREGGGGTAEVGGADIHSCIADAHPPPLTLPFSFPLSSQPRP